MSLPQQATNTESTRKVASHLHPSVLNMKMILYLLLALDPQGVLPPAAFSLVCAVLLQVLQLGGSRGVENLTDAGTVPSLTRRGVEKRGESVNQTVDTQCISFLPSGAFRFCLRKHIKSVQTISWDQ